MTEGVNDDSLQGKTIFNWKKLENFKDKSLLLVTDF